MKKNILAVLIIAGILSSCEEDPVDVKDYGLKTFQADMMYDPDAPHGSVAYKQQTFFAFGEVDAVSTATYGGEYWTDFVLVVDSSGYNTSAELDGWDLVFSAYCESLETDQGPVPYGVTGVLLNLDNNLQVARIKYTDSDVEADISQAFAELSISDLGTPDYSSEINIIGYDWKEFDFATMSYTLNTNWFYLVKMSNGDVYKLRFVSFYGTTSEDRIIKIEYQSMQ